MLKLGDKVRLKTAKRSLQTSAFSNKRVDADTDRVHTIERDKVQSPRRSCDSHQQTHESSKQSPQD